MERAYDEIMGHLLHKRHPVTRHITYLDSAVTNPVATWSVASYYLSDIESVEIDDAGADLTSTYSSLHVLKPRDWEFVRNELYGNSPASDPEYYTLFQGNTGTYEMFVAALPSTAGTNSIRIVHFGIQDWGATSCPIPPEFDTLLTLKTAIRLRIQKDLEINDLRNEIAPLEMRLFQATWEPRPENDYQIPCAGRSTTRTRHNSRFGWIRRY